MKKILTVFLTLMLVFAAWSQPNWDTIPKLVITQAQVANGNSGYLELTNLGDSTLDMTQFGVGCVSGNGSTPFHYVLDENGAKIRLTVGPGRGGFDPLSNTFNRSKLTGTLAPGESYVIMTFSDVARSFEYPGQFQTRLNNEAKIKIADYFVHTIENQFFEPFIDNPAIQSFDHDSVDVGYDILWVWQEGGLVLWYFTPEDSFVIDLVNTNLDDKDLMTRLPDDVAGTAEAIRTNSLVRKKTVTHGTIDWDFSRGASEEDSEWLLSPVDNFNQWNTTFPTSLGNHGDFHINVTSELYDIDLDAGTMTVPWGTQKRDSVLQGLEMGDGMSVIYIMDTLSVDDSAHTICMDGDILELYAYGNLREKKSLMISVAEPAKNIAELFNIRRRNVPDPVNDPYGTWSTPFPVTESQPGKDSIRLVPYGTRVDTVLKYMEKAPGASWEMIWVDGVERADLKFGDIIKVTSEDGTVTKEYVISVEDFEPAHNAFLSSLTWPDYPADLLLDWTRADTIPAFVYSNYSYNIMLPYGSKSVPGFVAKPDDPNAKVTVNRATSLYGGIGERTTTITVVAEDDSVTNVYAILFQVETLPEDFQKYIGEPYISEIHVRWWWNNDYMEIYNPSDEDLDMSQYLFLSSNLKTPPEALGQYVARDSVADWRKRFRKYVPGYLYGDWETFQTEGWILHPDQKVNPIVGPHQTFLMTQQGNPVTQPTRYQPWLKAISQVDFSNPLSGFSPNTWDDPNFTFHEDMLNRANNWNSFMFKIINDSVLDGQKEVGVDVGDYELIDCWGFNDYAKPNQRIADRELNTPTHMEWRCVRKPYVYKGTLTLQEDFDSTAEGSAWIVDRRDDPWIVDRMVQLQTLGNHSATPVTIHLSKVSSLVYKVSSGFVGLQSIEGDMNATTVTGFYANLIKGDPAQMLEVHSSADGSVKAEGDNIAGNDTLIVVAANGENSTSYLLVNNPLDNNATLVAKGGSGLVVAIDGGTGTITGVDFGSTIQSVLDKVDVPALAVLTVLDQNGVIKSLKIMKYDSTMNATTVGANIYFEVVAEDGTTITYHLMPATLSSDAYVISDVFTVDQVGMRISGIPEGIAITGLFDNIEIVPGATAMVLDKLGMERPVGVMAYDDLLLVVSQDGTKRIKYALDFLNEENPDWSVAVEEISSPKRASVLVYPNPANEMITLDLDQPLEVKTTLRIFNITGGLVDAVQLNQGVSRHQMDISGYSKGIYYLQLVQGNRSIATQKLIVQ